MLVTNIFQGTPDLGLRTIERVYDEVETVVAIKDDVHGEFARKMTAMVHEKWAAFSGGGKQAHLEIAPYGSIGFMSTFIMFQPRVTTDYWDAIQRGNCDRAGKVVEDHDWPFMDYIMHLQGGLDTGIHGVLELYGTTQRWRRNPYHSLDDQEMERLRNFFEARGWL